MEYKLASDFKTKVKSLLSAQEYDSLLDVLSTYLNDSDINMHKMIQSLHKLIDSPEKLVLYDHVRFLIPLKQQQEYSRLVPNFLRTATRIVRMERRSHEPVGFSLRGGFEHGTGVYVSAVSPNSHAAQKGLRKGDEVLFINGFTLEKAVHDDAVSLVRAAIGELTLRVRSIGMLPYRNAANAVRWTKVDDWENFENVRHHRDRRQPEIMTVAIRVPPGGALGCSIRTAKEESENAGSIYVELVKPDSLADQVGLEVGDEIVEANGVKLTGLSTQEVIKALKSQADVELKIKKSRPIDDPVDTTETANVEGNKGMTTTAIIENFAKQLALDDADEKETSAGYGPDGGDSDDLSTYL